MVGGAGAWLKKTYDRIIAAGVLVILLVSLILLANQALVQKAAQQAFDQHLADLKPKFGTVAAADQRVFQAAGAALANPLQNEIWAVSLLTPELRVKCVACPFPIPYAATTCTWCNAVQPEIPEAIVDKNKNSIPDEWEEKSGLFSYDTAVIEADPDNDGFTTREEFEWKTDPKDPASHPPYLAKLRVADIKPIPFRMVFKGVSKAAGESIFQINLRTGGRTYWPKLNEEVEGFKVASYDEKASDGPTLTLVHDGKQIPLIKGHPVPRDDYEVRLVSLLDGTAITVRPDIDFELKGVKYRVKKVDTQMKRVQIADPVRKEDRWVERQISEPPQEAR